MLGRALIFDFDGLIVDSETPEYLCWKRVYEGQGQPLTAEEWVFCVGGAGHVDFAAMLDERLGKKLAWDEIHPGRIAYHQELMKSQPVLPGVERLMKEGKARGWRIGVASNSSFGWVDGGIKRYGLASYVEAIRSRDRVDNPKPHRDHYTTVVQDLECEAGNSIAFEDSATGIAGAKAAGLYAVAVPNALTKLHDLSQADLILESLEHFTLPD